MSINCGLILLFWNGEKWRKLSNPLYMNMDQSDNEVRPSIDVPFHFSPSPPFCFLNRNKEPVCQQEDFS